MFEEAFYKRLTSLRMENGVSARDMSLSLGQNASYINGLENHKGLPSMTVFFYICDYFKITPAEFFDEDNTSPEKLRDIINDMKSLNSDQLNVIQLMINELKKKYK